MKNSHLKLVIDNTKDETVKITPTDIPKIPVPDVVDEYKSNYSTRLTKSIQIMALVVLCLVVINLIL